jgi:hypothetical protein
METSLLGKMYLHMEYVLVWCEVNLTLLQIVNSVSLL